MTKNVASFNDAVENCIARIPASYGYNLEYAQIYAILAVAFAIKEQKDGPYKSIDDMLRDVENKLGKIEITHTGINDQTKDIQNAS